MRAEDKSLLWESEEKNRLFDCVLFTLNGVKRKSKDGREGTFITLDSKNWIVAIPFFRDESGKAFFLMEEQYRHGSDSVTREFPAGLVEDGESGLEAAKRELLEETGMVGDMTFLSEVNPNSAFMTNRQSFYFVENLKKVGNQDLDPNEEIRLVSVPVSEAVRDMGSGIYDNGVMLSALALFLRLALKRPELLS